LLAYLKQLHYQKEFFIKPKIHSIEFKIHLSPTKFMTKVNIFLSLVTQTKQYISADSSFCWAFGLSTMIRHSVHYFLGQLAMERPMRFHTDKICEATKFLNDLEFHKRLRNGSYRSHKFFQISDKL